jgi:hypothetical protein
MSKPSDNWEISATGAILDGGAYNGNLIDDLSGYSNKVLEVIYMAAIARKSTIDDSTVDKKVREWFEKNARFYMEIVIACKSINDKKKKMTSVSHNYKVDFSSDRRGTVTEIQGTIESRHMNGLPYKDDFSSADDILARVLSCVMVPNKDACPTVAIPTVASTFKKYHTTASPAIRFRKACAADTAEGVELKLRSVVAKLPTAFASSTIDSVIAGAPEEVTKTITHLPVSHRPYFKLNKQVKVDDTGEKRTLLRLARPSVISEIPALKKDGRGVVVQYISNMIASRGSPSYGAARFGESHVLGYPMTPANLALHEKVTDVRLIDGVNVYCVHTTNRNLAHALMVALQTNGRHCVVVYSGSCTNAEFQSFFFTDSEGDVIGVKRSGAIPVPLSRYGAFHTRGHRNPKNIVELLSAEKVHECCDKKRASLDEADKSKALSDSHLFKSTDIPSLGLSYEIPRTCYVSFRPPLKGRGRDTEMIKNSIDNRIVVQREANRFDEYQFPVDISALDGEFDCAVPSCRGRSGLVMVVSTEKSKVDDLIITVFNYVRHSLMYAYYRDPYAYLSGGHHKMPGFVPLKARYNFDCTQSTSDDLVFVVDSRFDADVVNEVAELSKDIDDPKKEEPIEPAYDDNFDPDADG